MELKDDMKRDKSVNGDYTIKRQRNKFKKAFDELCLSCKQVYNANTSFNVLNIKNL